jgi:hypothetical protein
MMRKAGATLSRFVRFGLLVGAVGMMMTDHPTAEVSTHKINAKGFGQNLGGGNTQARIIGGGLLNGTTTAHFDVTGGSFPVFLIEGDVTFTTTQGATLTVHISGTFDVASGEFSASGPVTGSTGRLAGATGILTLSGVEDTTDGTFVEDVSGSISVDLAP